MKLNTFAVLSFLTCFLIAVPPIVAASDNTEVFVVALDSYSNSYYMESAGDGQFTLQELIGSVGGYSYGNGIGDFDNDGDLDLIMGSGTDSGSIHLFEKLGPGNNFVAPREVAVWGEGNLPLDIAVADFDADGNLDFILPQYKTTDCELYIGDGKLGFTSSVIPDSTPRLSVGADAADFNNDGHADFIVAPYMSNANLRYFYVNLGNGDGTFTTIEVQTYKPEDSGFSTTYWGITAGDFDGDGIADLVATTAGFYDIYLGVGDGTFHWEARIPYEDSLQFAPVDNYDFNGDQFQDFVIGGYGAPQDVGVFLGDGEGGFTHSNTIDGGGAGVYYAISAPPYVQNKNKSPVAVLDPAFQEIYIGEAVFLNAAGSYDEDGEIVQYTWNYGDQSLAKMQSLNGDQSLAKMQSLNEGLSGQHVYYQAGIYTITLTVTDDKGATASVQAQAQVSEKPLAVKIRFTPRTLNPDRNGKWVQATIQLPRGYDASHIDLSSVCIVENGKTIVHAHSDRRHLEHKWKKFKKRFKRKRIIRRLKVKFDRQPLLTALASSPPGEKILVVKGTLSHNGGSMSFEGSSTIRKIEPCIKPKPDKKEKEDKKYKPNERSKKLMKFIMKFKKLLYTWLKYNR